MTADSVVATPAARRAMIRERQQTIYGASLRTLVHGLTDDYGISHARLADTIGISRAMLSQLVCAKRIKIGDPLAATRLMILVQRRTQTRTLTDRPKIDAILADVAQVRQPWPRHTRKPDNDSGRSGTDLLRRAATPEQLTAAATQLEEHFPELADVLRHAAAE